MLCWKHMHVSTTKRLKLLGLLATKNVLLLFGFPIFWPWKYLMNAILEKLLVHYVRCFSLYYTSTRSWFFFYGQLRFTFARQSYFFSTFNWTLSQEQASLSQDVLVVSKRITSDTSVFQGDLWFYYDFHMDILFLSI